MSAQDDRNDRLYSDLNRESNLLAEQESAAVAALRSSGFEYLDGMVWHRPGGTAAEITRHGEIRVTIVRHGISIQAGPIRANRFAEAIVALDEASEKIGVDR